MSGHDFYVPKDAVVPRWWVCPEIGTIDFLVWTMTARPPIQVEAAMGRAAARYLANGHSPARTRKYLVHHFPRWASLAGELVDAVQEKRR